MVPADATDAERGRRHAPVAYAHLCTLKAFVWRAEISIKKNR
jgi:hypothetical protein